MFNTVKDQARRAFGYYARACVRNGRRPVFGEPASVRRGGSRGFLSPKGRVGGGESLHVERRCGSPKRGGARFTISQVASDIASSWEA